MDVVEKARVFAIAAHSAVKQVRKYTGEPYWIHPIEVAGIVSRVTEATPSMIAAAHLHDVIEDTGVTLEIVESEFGADVAKLVFWLTDASKPEDGNRATRKAIDREHIAQAPAEAQTIKCCDILSNVRSIVAHDPAFAVIYLEEKKQLVEVLTKANPAILGEVHQLLEASEQILLAVQTKGVE